MNSETCRKCVKYTYYTTACISLVLIMSLLACKNQGNEMDTCSVVITLTIAGLLMCNVLMCVTYKCYNKYCAETPSQEDDGLIDINVT